MHKNVLPPFPLSWLSIAVASLAASGLFSIIISVAWHPSIQCNALFETLFHRSLIAHVNLSISVWFIAVLFMLWSAPSTSARLAYYDATARGLMIISIISMSVAALLPSAIPHLSNYIPTLEHPLFFLSLGCMIAAAFVKMIEATVTTYHHTGERDYVQLFIRTSVVMLAIAIAAFIASYHAIDQTLQGELYYEMLFWGGGHVLQFLWVSLLLMAWMMMLRHLVKDYRITRAYRALLIINAAMVLATPIPYLLYDVTSGDFRRAFSFMMACSGVTPVLFVALFITDALKGKHRLIFAYRRNAVGACMWWSLILFGIGGTFAVMIDGINVKIPAHYHGSLLGVTLALMGLLYLILIERGHRFISTARTARWQPALLGIGQVMHVVGLFVSGGYGVQRKDPCAQTEAVQQADIALRIQSSGGGIAIIGGLLFVIVCLRAWRRHKKRA